MKLTAKYQYSEALEADIEKVYHQLLRTSLLKRLRRSARKQRRKQKHNHYALYNEEGRSVIASPFFFLLHLLNVTMSMSQSHKNINRIAIMPTASSPSTRDDVRFFYVIDFVVVLLGISSIIKGKVCYE